MKEIISKEAQQAVEAASQQLALTIEFSVVSAEDYIQAGEQRKIIKRREKEIDALRRSLTKPLDESKAKIMDFFRPALEQLALADQYLENSMLSWKQEQERIRKAEEERLQALAIKKQERLLELANKRAAKWEAKGKSDKAQAILDSVPVVPIAAVESKVPKIAGVSTRTDWKHRIVCEASIPREWLIPDDKKIAAFARATKGTITIPGIEFYSEQILPTRS